MTITHLGDVMNPFWDPWFQSLIDGINMQLGSGDFMNIAKEIAAILSLIYLSVKAYAMILGEGRLEIMPLLRPFCITLVIVNFGLFASIVSSIGNAAKATEQTAFQANAQTMDGLIETKDSLYKQMWTRVIDSSQSVHAAMTSDLNTASNNAIDNSGEGAIAGWADKQFTDAANSIQAYITMGEELMWIKISMWLQKTIESFVIACFKGVAYCMFFIQMLLMHVLLVLGPVSMAMSIVKPFKDAWFTWVQRYFAVSFYVPVALIALNMGIAIISYGIQQETSRMQQILSTPIQGAFLKELSNMDNFLGFLLIALFVVIGGIIQVPKVCGWILGAGGDAAEGYHGLAMNTARKTGSAVLNTVGSGAKAIM